MHLVWSKVKSEGMEVWLMDGSIASLSLCHIRIIWEKIGRKYNSFAVCGLDSFTGPESIE